MPFWHTVVVVDTCNNGKFDLVFIKTLKNAYNNSCLDIHLETVGSENHFELYYQFKRIYEIKNSENYGCLRQPFQNGSLWKSGTDEIAQAPFWTVFSLISDLQRVQQPGFWGKIVSVCNISFLVPHSQNKITAK